MLFIQISVQINDLIININLFKVKNNGSIRTQLINVCMSQLYIYIYIYTHPCIYIIFLHPTTHQVTRTEIAHENSR